MRKARSPAELGFTGHDRRRLGLCLRLFTPISHSEFSLGIADGLGLPVCKPPSVFLYATLEPGRQTFIQRQALVEIFLSLTLLSLS